MTREWLQQIGRGLMGERPDWRRQPDVGGPQITPGIQRFPIGPMHPGGFGTVPDPGFQPARPRFPGDPGMDPGMTPPTSRPHLGPVPLGGRRAMPWRY
jgi:hypothetical protein